MTFTSRRKRRSFAAATTAAAAALPLLIAIPGTAHADESATCAPNGKTYVVNSVGSLLQYTMATPLTGSTFSGYSQVGAGWGAYGKVLAGPKGEFYAFKSDGTYYAHRTDSGTWDVNPKRISTALGWLGNAADREQATVDRDGWLWVADNLGQLYAYRYDPTIGTSGGLKSLKILDKGWNRYNLITAGDKGVLYGRAADGRLYRSRYDVTSQRWIERHVLVGSAAWGNFKTITAGGGDTLVTVRTSGEALYYRYDENTRTWPVVAKQVAAGGWQNFPNVTSRPDNCSLIAQHTPAAPSVPIEDYSRASVLQSSAGAVEFAYARHDGTVRHGRMANPNKIDEVQWSSISEFSEAFTGEPSLAEQADGRVTVTAHSIIGGVWMLNQTARSSPEWANWSDQAGAMAQHAVTAKTPAGLLVQFAVDAGGKPWYRIQTAVNADFMGWMPLAGPKLTGLTASVRPGRYPALRKKHRRHPVHGSVPGRRNPVGLDVARRPDGHGPTGRDRLPRLRNTRHSDRPRGQRRHHVPVPRGGSVRRVGRGRHGRRGRPAQRRALPRGHHPDSGPRYRRSHPPQRRDRSEVRRLALLEACRAGDLGDRSDGFHVPRQLRAEVGALLPHRRRGGPHRHDRAARRRHCPLAARPSREVRS